MWPTVRFHERVNANSDLSAYSNREFQVDQQSTQRPRVSRLCSLAPIMVVLSIGAIIAIGAQVQAQVRFGTIVGNVTDPQGASVIGAKVTLSNLGTGETKTFDTGSGGLYAFPNLVPGQYKVVVEQSGFKLFTVQNVQVQVDVTTRVDATLQVGNATETVEVQANAVMLQTEGSSLGSVVTGETVQNVPVSGRNVNSLSILVPGVAAGGSTYGTNSGIRRTERARIPLVLETISSAAPSAIRAHSSSMEFRSMGPQTM